MSVETDIPLLGRSSALPFMKSLDFDGSYRAVHNSLVGNEGVWSTSLRWKVDGGLLRGSRSRNFREPAIEDVISPAAFEPEVISDPCSNTEITSGLAPATRVANCLALFTANPAFGLDQLPAGVPNTPQNRLANFTGAALTGTFVTFSGNPNLKSEVADTTTFGLVFEPTFVRGLSISADYVRIDLTDALTLYSDTDFADACFDSPSRPVQYCDTLGYASDGQINSAISTTVNADTEVMDAEVIDIDYGVPLDSLSNRLGGNLNLVLRTTHNAEEKIIVAETITRMDGIIAFPRWVVRFEGTYNLGPFGFFYSMNYLPPSLLTYTSTVENSTGGVYQVASNITQNVSVSYVLRGKYTLRAGVNNLADTPPSYPTGGPFSGSEYGDVIGHEFFVGIDARF